jgi:hypothetical protein
MSSDSDALSYRLRHQDQDQVGSTPTLYSDGDAFKSYRLNSVEADITITLIVTALSVIQQLVFFQLLF